MPRRSLKGRRCERGRCPPCGDLPEAVQKRSIRELRRLGFHDGTTAFAKLAAEVGWFLVHDRIQMDADTQNTKLWVDLNDPLLEGHRQQLITCMFLQALRPTLYAVLMDMLHRAPSPVGDNDPLIRVFHELHDHVMAPPHLRFMLYFNGRTMLAEEQIGCYNVEARVGAYTNYHECSLCGVPVTDYTLPYQCTHLFCRGCRSPDRRCPHPCCRAEYLAAVKMNVRGVERIMTGLARALACITGASQLESIETTSAID